MHSSTSSSEPSLRGHWLTSWLLALAIVCACVAGWEIFWRDHDFQPSVTDDASLWSLSRYRANQLGDEAVVLVGSSRMQMDIQRDAFARATGWEPAVQLAVVRGPSVPVLEHLAADPDFRGTVLCEVNAVLFFAHTPNIDHMLDDYFRTFDSMSAGGRVEQRLSMLFQQQFVTRLPDLAYTPLRYAWNAGRAPLPSYNAFISPDRFRYGDYVKVPNLKRVNQLNQRLMRQTTPRVMLASQLAERLRAIHGYVEEIEGRGGRVIFVHLPSSRHVLEYEKRWWKREATWDKLEMATNADMVHYEDYPRLRQFSPPDGDHLGRDAADIFSMELGRILVAAELAPGPR